MKNKPVLFETKILNIFIILILLLVSPVSLQSQSKVSISGFVKDSINGESLMGAYVSLKRLDFQDEIKGNVTNQSGFYSITVDKGTYLLAVNLLGYNSQSDTLILNSQMTRNFQISHFKFEIDEVVILGERPDRNVSSVDVGKIEMSIQNIKSIPALMGEADILKAIQLLPGVQSGGEANSGFYVRGGGADQNLLLLDEATIYNASHLFGFFSIFNAQAVKDIELYKSGIPAQYGSRLSSILDVHQKEGNLKKIEGDAGIGVIFSRFTLQGPIKKDTASFIVSARRTYIDLLMQPFLKKDNPMKGVDFYFYDINAKLNWIVNNKHRLYLGGYYGKDVYGFKSKNGSMKASMKWANAAASFRWNYIISNQLFLNTSTTFSLYDFTTDMTMGVYSFKLNSGVMDGGMRSELTYIPSFPHIFKLGIDYIFHKFMPNTYSIDAGESNSFSMPKSTAYYANEFSIFANDEFDLAKWLKINLGVRYTHFNHIGAFVRYVIDETGQLTDSIIYKPGQIIHQYNKVEPRFSARFRINKQFSIKTSFTINYQYIHQVSMASISLPTDVWMPSTDIVKPQRGIQGSLGLFYNFNKNMFESYVDLYYKDMKNLVEYRDGMDLTSVKMNPDQLYVFGSGYSYGAEFYLKKNRGRFKGFIGYTLAFTVRNFPDLNCGKPFYAKYDRRHDVSINLTVEIIKNKLSASTVWVYSTGNTMTIPTGLYFFGGTFITEYSEKNGYRMPPYHRLDISVDWTIYKSKKFETGLNFSVYNTYNRRNPFFIYIESNISTNTDTNLPEISMQGKQMSLFPILPSISWNFKF